MTPNELVLTFRGSYICANFGENRSRNAAVRVLADGHTDRQTDRHTDANRFYNLSHAIAMGQITSEILLPISSVIQKNTVFWCRTYIDKLHFKYIFEVCTGMGMAEIPWVSRRHGYECYGNTVGTIAGFLRGWILLRRELCRSSGSFWSRKTTSRSHSGAHGTASGCQGKNWSPPRQQAAVETFTWPASPSVDATTGSRHRTRR